MMIDFRFPRERAVRPPYVDKITFVIDYADRRTYEMRRLDYVGPIFDTRELAWQAIVAWDRAVMAIQPGDKYAGGRWMQDMRLFLELDRAILELIDLVEKNDWAWTGKLSDLEVASD